MGIFDFFKKRKRQEQNSLDGDAYRQKEDNEHIEFKRISRLNEIQNTQTMEPFTFKSNCHQRYENNVPVNGLQKCIRSIIVVKNTNGCSGYKLEPYIGYIIKIFNDDMGIPNMSDKPMKIIRKTENMVELRGFPIEAMSPLGWQKVDNSNYGLVVYYKNGNVEKCILHMYERNTYIEYRKTNDTEDVVKSNTDKTQKIVDAATIGLHAAEQGNRQIEQENLINLFNLTQNKSSQLLHIPTDKYNLVGSGFCLLLEYPQAKYNEEIYRAIANYAFFCISKAIENEPNNKTLHLMRTSVVAQTRECFFYTVAKALKVPDSNPFDIRLSAPLIVRTNDYIYAMGKFDFENGNDIVYEGALKEFHDLCYGLNVKKSAKDGKDYIDKVNDYIANSLADFRQDNTLNNITSSAKEKVKECILADGKKYNGWGFYSNGQFIPHGCGKKFFTGFYIYGNFKKGVLNGPAIKSHDYFMYTMFFKENRGNGWGLHINRGDLVEFGYYENGELKNNLADYVQWYYEEKLGKSGRLEENMMTMYSSKETKEVTTLLIGFAPKKIFDTLTLPCMGFRFKADESVWVGTGNINEIGYFIHFKPNGCIDIGRFDNGSLVERISLQNLIDKYLGEDVRELYRNIEEPKINYNYFTEEYNNSDDLPF